MAYTALADIIEPDVFAAYTQELTEVKSRMVESGLAVRSGALDAFLAGGGRTFDMPAWNDLADVAANISTSLAGSAIVPENVTSKQETAVRLSRNQAWGSADLLQALAGSDPLLSAANRASDYWTRQLQLAIIATADGVFADNTANDSGDYTFDNSNGGVFAAGVTTFSAEAFIDTLGTIGDSEAGLGIVFMHSVVYNRARKNNLIEFQSDSANPLAAAFPTFLGRRVFVDDGMPNAANVHETWLFGPGAFAWGVGSPRVPAAVDRLELDADGGGTEFLISRVEWTIHPMGHRYIGTAAPGGPSNAGTANNLGAAGSWDRTSLERKQNKWGRLLTTEA